MSRFSRQPARDGRKCVTIRPTAGKIPLIAAGRARERDIPKEFVTKCHAMSRDVTRCWPKTSVLSENMNVAFFGRARKTGLSPLSKNPNMTESTPRAARAVAAPHAVVIGRKPT
jgi:hypothetical protein